MSRTPLVTPILSVSGTALKGLAVPLVWTTGTTYRPDGQVGKLGLVCRIHRDALSPITGAQFRIVVRNADTEAWHPIVSTNGAGTAAVVQSIAASANTTAEDVLTVEDVGLWKQLAVQVAATGGADGVVGDLASCPSGGYVP